MSADPPRGFIVAAPSSGSGKTTLTLGLLAALKRRGLRVQAFKCGPDFIDPTLHWMVTGRYSRNLDIAMCGPDYVHGCISRHSGDADVVVVEGVMGLFDGGAASTAAVARLTGLPVVLVLDAGKMAESAAAVVKGFESLDPRAHLSGVILNNVGGDRHRHLLMTSIEAACTTPVIGCILRDASFRIPERHLGLHMGHESPINDAGFSRLSEMIEGSVDLDGLLHASLPVHANPFAEPQAANAPGTFRLAIALDEAFCFYYEDNLDLLRQAGAVIVPFSPLADRSLPDDIQALYLGGGYPELHAARLAANTSMLASIRDFINRGGLTYAECGGFMALTEGITDAEGRFHPLTGCFPTRAHMRKGRAQLGYRHPRMLADTFLGTKGQVLHGHEFHYSEIDPMPGRIERIFCDPPAGLEGYRVNNAIGSYLHAHFGGTPEICARLATSCLASVQPTYAPKEAVS